MLALSLSKCLKRAVVNQNERDGARHDERTRSETCQVSGGATQNEEPDVGCRGSVFG